MKFRADVAGTVTGVRFYKGTGNTGTHVGHLWSSTGTLLGTVTFSGETASGWQQASFTTPGLGHGRDHLRRLLLRARPATTPTTPATSAAPVSTTRPLHALADGVSGANGVYHYGTGGGFPTDTWQASNYWVDLVFTPN